MPTVEWSLLCDYCLIDQTGKLSLIGIFDSVAVASFPAQHPMLYVVTRWRSEPGQTFVAETRIWTPTEKLLVTTGPVQVAPNPGGHNLTVNQLRNVAIEREGQYLVELLAEGETARYYPWQVLRASAPS